MWKEEIETKLYPGTLSVLVYHGASRPKDPHKYLSQTLLLITTDYDLDYYAMMWSSLLIV